MGCNAIGKNYDCERISFCSYGSKHSRFRTVFLFQPVSDLAVALPSASHLCLQGRSCSLEQSPPWEADSSLSVKDS